MNAVRHIGHNDLRLFFRDRAALIWLFAIPLAFTYFMGFAVRGPGDPANPAPGILIENHDTGAVSRLFLDAVGTQGLTLLDPTNRDQAKRGIRIPADFTQRVLRQETARVEFFTLPDSGDAAAALIELRLVRALIDANSRLVEWAVAHPGDPLTEASLTQASRAADTVILKSSFAGHKPMPVGFRMSVPGNLVAYLMMNLLIFGGASVAWERRSGVLRRLAIHPLRPGTLIAGKIYGLLLLGTTQSAILLVAGRFLFGVRYGEQLPAILLTLLLYAWVASSLGVLIGSLVRAEDKVVGLCVLISLVMAALGGCWWPLEIVPDVFRTLSHVVPTGWAMDALHQLITFGGGLSNALKPLGVLALFGAAANLATARLFRV